jgi:hypothetical protein
MTTIDPEDTPNLDSTCGCAMLCLCSRESCKCGADCPCHSKHANNNVDDDIDDTADDNDISNFIVKKPENNLSSMIGGAIDTIVGGAGQYIRVQKVNWFTVAIVILIILLTYNLIFGGSDYELDTLFNNSAEYIQCKCAYMYESVTEYFTSKKE